MSVVKKGRVWLSTKKRSASSQSKLQTDRQKRRMLLETLEDRRLLAVGPQLIGIQPNDGDLLRPDDPDQIRDVAPRELRFRFDENQSFTQAQYDEIFLESKGIQITRSTLDGEFAPASVETDFGLGGVSNVNVRFFAARLGTEHNGITLVFTKRDQGTFGPPEIGVLGNRVDITLNVNQNNETTAQQLVDAINEHADASNLIRAELVPDSGGLLHGDTDIASGPINYSPLTLAGANDTVIRPGFVGQGDTPNELVVRFAENLPDDIYQVDIFGEGNLALRNATGEAFNDINDDSVDDGSNAQMGFELDLGARVISVVPQPVQRLSNGTLVQQRDQIIVYFNDDDLLPESAENTSFYQLIYSGQGSAGTAAADRPTLTNADDEVIFPQTAEYNSDLNAVLLTFANNIDDPARSSGTYRLRIGTAEHRPLAPRPHVPATDPGSTFTGFDNSGVPTVEDLGPVWDTGHVMVVLGDGDSFVDQQTFSIEPVDGSPSQVFEFVDMSILGNIPEPGNSPIAFDPGLPTPLATIATTIETAVNTWGAGVGVSSTVDAVTGPTKIRITGDANIMLSDSMQGLGLASEGVVITQEIVPPILASEKYTLQFPSADDEPGHRDIPIPESMHINGSDSIDGIETIQYNFRTEIGLIPAANGGTEPAFNDITEEQKERAREVFELISSYAGVQFVETAQDGMIVATGDLRTVGCFAAVCSPGIISEPGNVFGLAGSSSNGSIAIMDNAENWNDEFGGNWFEVAMHEIGHQLGLRHAYDLSAVMGGNHTPQTEQGFPGNHDIVHLQRLMRPESNDIDMYEFSVTEQGVLTAETTAERLLGINGGEMVLDTSINLYQVRVQTDPDTGEAILDGSGQLQPILDSNGEEIKDLVGHNDDYFSKDSYLELNLRPGKYYVGVTASGNSSYDPSVDDSGLGGRTQGDYELRLNFRPAAERTLVDADNPVDPLEPTIKDTAFDGDADGAPGGVYNFWFKAAAPSTGPSSGAPRTIYVDKSAPAGGDGTLASPFNLLRNALNVNGAGQQLPVPNLNAVQPGDILRILPNPGVDDDIRTEIDNQGYELGFNSLGSVLDDGAIFEVPQDVTVMVDAGAIFKMRRSWIAAGSVSTSPQRDRSGGAFQVLGAPVFVDALGNTLPQTGSFAAALPLGTTATGHSPEGLVHFTSYADPVIGLDNSSPNSTADKGDWGGIIFRNDIDQADQSRFDYESQGVFLNYVNHADLRYGGGEVVVESVNQVVAPVTIFDARPTISNNHLTLSRDAAVAATPNSFEETNFHSAVHQASAMEPFTYDYSRIGPEISNNRIVDNTINGMFISIDTPATGQLQKLTVPAKLDDNDIVHVLQENLVVQSTPGGPFLENIQEELDLVTLTPLQLSSGANLPLGTYTYRMVFVDANGFESPPTTATQPKTTLGFENAIRLSQLLPAPDRFVARRLYRSTAIGGAGPWELIAQINQSDTEYTDDGTTIGGELSVVAERLRPRLDARLAVDPQVIVKLDGTRIEVEPGAQLIAEGADGKETIFTSLLDDRYGYGGTFDTTNDGNLPAEAGNWGGLYSFPSSHLSLDHVVIAFGGGVNRIEGDFAGFNAIEIHQADARIANSVLEFNASGQGIQGPPTRFGRETNAESVIFVRNSQPIMVDNTIRNNAGTGTSSAAISINANALNAQLVPDLGRSTGYADVRGGFLNNHGPLIHDNRLDNNDINGVQVRGEVLTTASVWDDTTITHVLQDEVAVVDFHTSGGLRLQSNANASLVVKLQGANAGFVATGDPLEIDDRIGGAIQVVGHPKSPVILTSLQDDTRGSGVQLNGDPLVDTNNDGDASAPAPGDWNTILIDQYAHDANVDFVMEQERRDADVPGPNATAATAEYLGSLAINQKSGDDTRRLGFVVDGLISSPADVDVYSFEADAGTEVWVDFDKTTHAFDGVVELVDGHGTVLARSVNSLAESNGFASLYQHSSLTDTVHVMGKLPGQGGVDYWQTNQRDPGFRLVMPGPVGTTSTYHLRVRSNTAPDRIHLLDAGISAGAYQMSIRLGERESFAGSTVRYADIAYADTGITVLGQPIHSPLSGEKIESGNNNTRAAADFIGNVLEVDRGATSIAGRLLSGTDADWYEFQLTGADLRGNTDNDANADPDNTWSMTFDLDYADGLGRANTSLYLYDANGNLVAFSSDSNVADDQPQPGVDSKVEDLSRGSVGVTDPMIGPVSLREGTYFMAVTTNQVTSAEMSQYLQPTVGNPFVRLEPVNSVKRIAEDHLNVLGSAPHTTFENSEIRDLFSGGARAVDWHLGDVTLYVLTNDPNSRGSSLVSTVDAFTGEVEVSTPNGPFGDSDWDLNDIAFDAANNLFSVSTGADGVPNCDWPNDIRAGEYIQIDTRTGVVSDVGQTGILTYEDNNSDPATAERQLDLCGQADGTGFHMDAMFFAGNNLYAVGRRGLDGYDRAANANASTGFNNPDDEWRTNVIFRLDPTNGNALGAPHNSAQLQEAWTSHWTVGRVDLSATVEPDAIVTGIAELNGFHYVVDNEGYLHRLAFTVPTFTPAIGQHGVPIPPIQSRNVHERSGSHGAPVLNDLDLNFQGLVAPPAFVEGTRYADLLFAVTDSGDIVAIQTDAAHFGEVARVFSNGEYMVNTGLANARGLAFSDLEQNLFNVTLERGSADLLEGGVNDNDKGHGIDTLIDGSRDDTLETLGPGGQSLAFSGVNYDRNGGAHGTVISNEFSLRDVSAGDRPTLYFTYFAQTDGGTDAFRAFISDNSGQWQPIAATNGDGTAMFDGTNSWRQARIPLSNFVGADHLRLRLDFSTAGDMNYGDARGGTEIQTHGSELYGIDGSYLRDGDSFTLVEDVPGFFPPTEIFEFESGFTFVAPSGKAIPQNSTVTVQHSDPAVGTTTFTFERVDPALDVGGNTIFIADSDDASDVVQKLASRLDPAVGHHINGERLNFEAVKIDNHVHPTLTEPDVPGVTNVSVTGLPATVVEGDNGVGSTVVVGAHEPVWIHEGMTREEVAAEIHDSLEDVWVLNQIPESYRTEVDADPTLLEADGFKIWNDMVRIIGYEVADHGPLGYHAGALAGDVAGDTVGYHNPARFNNNAFNGVFIDDVIIGMAGRGEMVVSANANDGFVANTESDGNEVVQGTYQLEIRRSSEVLDVEFNPIRSWHMDDRLSDGASFVVSSGAYIHDGEFFDISDGVSSVRFEYEDTELGDGVQSGNVAIPFDSTMEDWEVTRAVRDAINRFEVNAMIDVTAGLSDGTINDPTNTLNPFPDLRVDPLYTPTSTTNVVNLFGDAYLVNDPSDRLVPRPVGVGEFNDTILTATPTTIMGAGTRYVASGNIGDNDHWSLEPSTDVDLFQVQMTTGEQLTIRVDAESIDSNLDAVLRVFNAGGTELDRDDDTNGLDPELTFTAPVGGLQVFYVGVSSIPDSVTKGAFVTSSLYDPNTLDTTGPNPREVGLILRDPAGNALREQVGDYRISMSFDTASVSFDSAVALQNVIYDSFSADPGWNGTFVTFNPPGYQADSSEATGEEFAGEIGGTFNVVGPGLYADTSISGLTLNDRIVGRGRLDHTSEFNPDFDNPMVLGHFDLAGPDDGRRLALGISFSEGPAGDLAWHAYLGGATGAPTEVGTRGPQIEISEDVGLDWSYTWNPTGGAEGAGQLTVNLGGDQQTLDMTTAQRIGFQQDSFNSFGFWRATEAGFGSAEIFVDDVYYTGTPQDNWGDRNLVRDQGQVLLQANTISHSASWGIRADEGARDAFEGASAHMGPVRNLAELNTVTNLQAGQGLVPGVVITNNLLHGNVGGAIRFSGTTAQPTGAVPFGRIVNNTVFGTGNGETGIQVDENASPTVLNNILANLGTGIDVDGTSVTTIVAASVYQDNTNDLIGVSEEFSAQATDPLFVDAFNDNFYLSDGTGTAPNPAIDSSVGSLEDRYNFVLVKDPLGIAPSPVIAPIRDMRGQLRVDNPNSEPVGGLGQNVFIDRGAIDASDFSGPTAFLINPMDNDPLGVDGNLGMTVVNLDGEVVSSFEVRLNDGQAPADSNEGIGIADSSVTADQVILRRDGMLLENGVDYSFSYNANNDTIRLTPLSGIWPTDSIYTVNLINRDQWELVAPHWDAVTDGDRFDVTDLAGNQTTFEFEYGYVINVPQTLQIQVDEAGAGAGGIEDGEYFTVRNGSDVEVVFEFDSDGQSNHPGGINNILIPFNPGVDTQDDIAQLIVSYLANTGSGYNLGLAPVNLGDGRVHLGSLATHQLTLNSLHLVQSGQAGGVADGGTFSVDDGSELVTFEFDSEIPSNVTPGNIPVAFTQADTNEDIADEIVIALADQTSGYDLGLQPVHLGEGRIFVGGNINHQLTTDPVKTRLTSAGQPGVRPELSLQIPTVAGVPTGIEDAETFSITVGGGTAVVFELNNTDVDPSADLSHVRIDFNNSTSTPQLADQIVLAITSAGLNLDPVHETGSAIVRIGNSTTAYNLNASNTHLVKLGEAGVSAAVGINLSEHFQGLANLEFDDRQIAVAMLDAIERDTILTDVEAWAGGGAIVTLAGADTVSDISRLVQPESSDLRANESWSAALEVADPSFITEIEDLAANPLKPNQLSGETKFTVTLGSVDLDFGDAADGLGQAPQNAYPVLSDSDAAIHMIPDDPSQTLWLGERLDRDQEGQSLIVEVTGNAAAMIDGEQFVITKGTRTEVFEFETAGNGVNPDTIEITVSGGQTAAQIAQTVADTINDTNLGMYVQVVGGGRLLLGTNYDVSIAGAPNNLTVTNVTSFGDDLDGTGYTVTTSGSGVNTSSSSTPATLSIVHQTNPIADGDTVSVSNGLVTATFEFNDLSTSNGVTFGNFSVPFASTDTNETVATALVAAMNQATVEADLVLNLNPLRSVADIEISGDDEDGVTNPEDPTGPAIGFLSPYVQREIVVNASSDGLLDAWIDFNRDGDWDDAAEQIFASQQLQAGNNSLTITTPFPPDYIVGSSFARFRISSTGGLRPTGLASDGETEDYPVELVPGTPPVPNSDPTTSAVTGYTLTENQSLPNSAPAPSLLANDTDADGDDFRILDPADPTNTSGSFTIFTANDATVMLNRDWESLGGGTFTYDPAAAQAIQALADPATSTAGVATSLVDTFTYDLIEALPYEFISTTSGVVEITVTGVNDSPNANLATAAAVEDGPAVQGDFNGDDVDADDDVSTLLYTITANPPAGQGTVTNNGNGTFAFNPGSGFQALAQGETMPVNFSYTATDQHGATSTVGTGTVTVTGVNDAPFATNDVFVVDQDAILDSVNDASVAGLFDNDVDVDTLDSKSLKQLNGGTQFNITTQKDATLTVTSNGSFVYDPTQSPILKALRPGQIAEDLFSYEVEDPHGASSVATVTIYVTGVNNAPEPQNDAYQTDQDEILTAPLGNIPGLLANDSDPDPDDSIVPSRLQGDAFGMANSITRLSARGAEVTLTLAGDLTYDPTVATATTLIALGGDDPPLIDTFTYSIGDGALEASATVSVTVSGVNKGPTVVDDVFGAAFAINEDNPYVVDGTSTDSLLHNDFDPEGDSFTITGLNGVSVLTGSTVEGAAVSLTPEGGFTYNPLNATNLQALADPSSSRPSSIVDTFTYTATDSNGGSNEATVHITVGGINDLPEPQHDLDLTVPLAVTTGISILANDVDVDSDMTMVCLISGPSSGDLELDVVNTDAGCASPNGSLVVLNGDDVNYTPDAGFAGTDQFEYRVKDDFGWSLTTATAEILVNDPPLANPDTFTVYLNTVNAVPVLDNDDDPDGDLLNPASVMITTPPTQGTASVQVATGAVLYTPDNLIPPFNDSFSYQVQDSDGALSNIAVVNLTILEDPFPWQNKPVREDVNNDGFVTPMDALTVINVINAGTYSPSGCDQVDPNTCGLLPIGDPTDVPAPDRYYDVAVDEHGNPDGYVTASDVMAVIAELNSSLNSGNPEAEAEGEGEPAEAAARQAAVQGSLLGNLDQATLDRQEFSSPIPSDQEAADPVSTTDPATTSDWQRLSSPLGQLPKSAPTAGTAGADDWGDWLDEVVDGIADARHSSDDTDIIDDLISGIFPSDS